MGRMERMELRGRMERKERMKRMKRMERRERMGRVGNPPYGTTEARRGGLRETQDFASLQWWWVVRDA